MGESASADSPNHSQSKHLMHFWHSLPRPIIGLSPMDGITDHPFRHITKKYGNPAVIYTEFTSVEGVCHGAVQLLKDFLFDEAQRPIIGQIYGTTPDFFRQTAIILCQLGYDGIDINMGCPAKNVAHSGAGAALIKNPELAVQIIHATQQGVREWQNGATADDCINLTQPIKDEVRRRHALLSETYQQPREIPISVKTRIGFDAPIVEEWIPTLLETEIIALALHGRTLKQHYGGQADWDAIARAAEIVHQTKTLILGNGDVRSLEDAHAKIRDYGVDGVLIGRGAMGNPFVFTTQQPTTEQLFSIALEHAQLFEESFKDDPRYNFLPMRKHLGWYIRDIAGASQMRQAVYKCNSSVEVSAVLHASPN